MGATQARAASSLEQANDAAGLRLEEVKRASLRAVLNMSYGEPPAARDAVCKEVVQRLKTGPPAQRQGCAEILQFLSASPAARVPLYRLQVLPSLVNICSTGEGRWVWGEGLGLRLRAGGAHAHLQAASSPGPCVGLPLAQHAAAEALTNMAAIGVTAFVPQQSSADKLAPRVAAAGDTVNLKLEVQRAGAVPALTALLKSGDEGCVQAAANALYVLAQEAENRSAMQQAGVVAALQTVIAKGKLRPPTVSKRTAQDCSEAMLRIC